MVFLQLNISQYGGVVKSVADAVSTVRNSAVNAMAKT